MHILLGSDHIWPIYNYLKIWNLSVQNNHNIEKIAFKIVLMKFLAMHITNWKWKVWFIYSKKFTKYLHGTWSLLNIRMLFGIKEKSIILKPYNVFFTIATNIPQRLKTGFVVQAHICVLLLSPLIYVI